MIGQISPAPKFHQISPPKGGQGPLPILNAVILPGSKAASPHRATRAQAPKKVAAPDLSASAFGGVHFCPTKRSPAISTQQGARLVQVRAGSKNDLEIMDTDPNLAPFREHLEYRYHKYLETKKAIAASEGGLDVFSQGFKRFGFNREDGAIVYREWAPAASAAQLIGDFNNWNGWGHQMQKNEYGVWTLRLPDIDGKPAIQHKSRVKIRMQRAGDVWVDRIPAWIKWATVEPGKMGATYDGVFWDPPNKFEFKHPKPPRPAAPRIYEAHVGMSSVEPKVASYLEFTENVLPRVAALGYNTIQLMAIMEHSYYGSFGYHVTNFFAVSSRSGTPDDLKVLIDRAHSLGIRVLLDIVHSHASNNVNDGLNGFDFNQTAADSYFHTGARGYHSLWDSRCFNYANWEVQRFLLSNLRWWLEEYHFDGFRFDGVTSMLYLHHGINVRPSSYSGLHSASLAPFGISTFIAMRKLFFLCFQTFGAIISCLASAPSFSSSGLSRHLLFQGGLLMDRRLGRNEAASVFHFQMSFTGNYHEYFGLNTDVDAVVYMMLANELVHALDPQATTIAEDVSGMPALCRPTEEGGVGFDYRLGMGIPDKWIDILKHRKDDEWSMGELVHAHTDRRYTEKTIAYAESHDQCMVGDKTIAFWLMDAAMYDGMSALSPPPPAVDRGIALHKMIHFLTMSLGGEGYLNFIGNEFGHPEWVDFPRQGNNWSHDKCRRRWDLADADHLRYKFMQAFDGAMQALDEKYQFLASSHQMVSYASEEDKVIVFERGELVFVFNFHPTTDYEGFKVGCDVPGKYRVALDSDAPEFGGHGRVDPSVDHFTSPEGEPGKPETNFNNRPNSFLTGAPPRTVQVYARVPEPVTPS